MVPSSPYGPCRTGKTTSTDPRAPPEPAPARGLAPEGENDQILFGDLHVHTTFSADAFQFSLPMLGGAGVHPVADACDFARYCSALDFWSITDHAETVTPLRWQRTKDSIRACQKIAGDGPNPDLVSFIGFEWTQVGRLPSEHFGHKNVIFKDLDDDKVSARAIGAFAILAPLALGDGPFRFLASSVMTTLGRWSYGIFIWHVAVLSVVFGLFGIIPFSGSFVLVWVITVVLSVGIAAASYAFVEDPVRRWAVGRSGSTLNPVEERHSEGGIPPAVARSTGFGGESSATS